MNDMSQVNEVIAAAESLRERGALREAIASYCQGIERIIGMSGCGSAYFNLAGCLEEVGELEEAVVWLKRAILADPGDLDAIYNAGFYSCRLGRYADGIPYFEMYLSQSPGDIDVEKALALARAQVAHR